MLFQNQGNPLFLLTPLREGRLQALYRAFDSKIISTHAPAGGATCTSPKQGQPTAISTHAPAGGATYTMIEYKYTIKISTHAPAGGATMEIYHQLKIYEISTHAPAGGATLRGLIILGAIYDFYSRPCGRGDRSRPPAGQGGSYFYSRPCGRGDARLRMLLCFLPQFLLTPLREGRRGHGGHDINGAAYFYSRPCGRGDEAARRRINERIEFLLTPLREGRPDAALQTDREDWISTHAPAGGATRRRRRLHTDAADFYSRPCGRGDRGGRTSRDTRPGFLLTPLREGRRTIDGGLCEECRFLLTPLREGRPASGTISVHVSLFLLTPLREGRRRHSSPPRVGEHISTHAPAGGATVVFFSALVLVTAISTHAPAGGATRQKMQETCQNENFYSRPCGRGDNQPAS